jgi:hypothetical protein
MDNVTTTVETEFLSRFEDVDDASDEQVAEFATQWCEEVNEGDGPKWKIDLRWYKEYADASECGEKGILSGNWNHVSRPVQNLLERAGYTLDWCDAVCECSGCNKAIQTQPSHYGWKPQYHTDSDGIWCEGCTVDAPDALLDDLRGNPNKALTLNGIDLHDHGYVRVEREFEHGWHPGQDDSPKAIAAALEARGIEDFIFSLDDVGQFDARFSVWVKREDAPAAANVEGKCAEPPNVTLQRALQNIPASTGQGIQYNRVTADGEVTTTYLTPEQFIEGVKA